MAHLSPKKENELKRMKRWKSLWFSTISNKNETLTRPILKGKAEEFGQRLEKQFILMEGWLSQWKL